ncbi:Rho guanine nucleotide exchange factor [Marasmius crinis-equi]|uniref:Rho guanine nucleotide exchange factor n=1 Tax=Marasmius crinis-equi TaxID=585013 RepID=A0ABR3EX68_9AGAR
MSKMKGTTRWMAPELFNSSQPSYESDVYAFACVCYEIYTSGLRPFYDIKNEAAAMLEIIKGTRPLRPENTPELDDRVWSVMESCWTQEPPGRPTSKAVLQDLREMLDCDLNAATTAPIDWRDKITASIWPNLQQQDVAFEVDEFVSYSASKARRKLRPVLSITTSSSAMSTTAVKRSSRLTDEDLQVLYDQASAGIATEDPPSSGEREIDGIYDVYGTDHEAEVNSPPISPLSAGHGRVAYAYRRPEANEYREPSPSFGVPVVDVYAPPPQGPPVIPPPQRRHDGMLAPEVGYTNGDYFSSSSSTSVNRVDSTGSYSNGLDAQGRPLSSQPRRQYPYPVPSPPSPPSASSFDPYHNSNYDAWDAGPSNSITSQGGANVVRQSSDMLRDIADYESGHIDHLDGIIEEGSRAYDNGFGDEYAKDYLNGVFVNTSPSSLPSPNRQYLNQGISALALINEPGTVVQSDASKDWTETVPPEVIAQLHRRQIIIHKIISEEDQYMQDLDTVETVFIKPLQSADPPVISPPAKLEEFINDVFGNILDLRECNRQLLEAMHVRRREQQYVIQRIGDVFLVAASEFRQEYPDYVGHHSLVEKRIKEEEENNSEFRLFLEHASRNRVMRQGQVENGAPRLDLKHFLNRPSEHLQKYPVLLESILKETAEGNPDASYLKEAIDATKDLQTFAQLRTFQLAMGKGAAGKWEWHDLVPMEPRKKMKKEEAKRQSIIFELIKGEMAYVKDLENIRIMYIQPLREANKAGNPIIAPERLEQFIKDVFHNYYELHAHHKRLVEKFHQIQQQQHPQIRSVTAAMFDAALSFRSAYMEYIPNYPIAAYRIDDELAINPGFKRFVEKCMKHPDAHRLDMKNFINRPIPRLLRYELLLKGVMEETPSGHGDRREIPQVLKLIKSISEVTEQKAELQRYNSNLVFKPGERFDMSLLAENRSLIHSGKMLRHPESGREWSGWCELNVLLFDHYLVFTVPKEGEGDTKYHVDLRPILLDLLTLGSFTDPAILRRTGLISDFRGFKSHAEGSYGAYANKSSGAHAKDNSGAAAPDDSSLLYPLTLYPASTTDGPYILYTESAQARTKWKAALQEALDSRKVIQEANKVFEMESLSAHTSLIPPEAGKNAPPAWDQENSFTGKVTCSATFNTLDGRSLVIIGCAEGVWIGFRHDPKSTRRVLRLVNVTQCAMLEEFGILIVLADKALFAYQIEALVPIFVAETSLVPQHLSSNKNVCFFSVGQFDGRTLVVYMKKKGLDSAFRVLEPVREKIHERAKQPTGLGSRILRQNRSEWFRLYREFSLPSESFDLSFLKDEIAILCSKGFKIMDLNRFKSVTIPKWDDPRLAQLAKRCDSSRPIGMFRSADDEFLLCYNEFGLFVNKHGDPSRAAGTIEWEGSAERVALHSPYVLLFDNRFIEIRQLETGTLVQIIPGKDIHCIWDGRGVRTRNHVISTSSHNRRAEVHVTMNSAGGDSYPRDILQKIFQFVPTVPSILDPPPPAYDDLFRDR